MRTRQISGWTLLLALSLIPVWLLFQFGPTKDLSTFGEATHALG
ncbi:MAG: hypothetical protein ABIH41_06195 [Nanoarchaeota archaeon]